MREWWDGWKALGKNGCAAVGSLLQNTIDYNTPPTIQPIPDIILDEDETAILDQTTFPSPMILNRAPRIPDAGLPLIPSIWS